VCFSIILLVLVLILYSVAGERWLGRLFILRFVEFPFLRMGMVFPGFLMLFYGGRSLMPRVLRRRVLMGPPAFD